MPFIKGQSGNPSGRPNGAKNKPKNRDISGLYREVIGTWMNGSFYVYAHYDEDGECFYVGKGSNERAWECAQHTRNDDWWKYVNEKGMKYSVSILAAGLSEDEALAVEAEVIRIRRPKTNIKMPGMMLAL